MLINIGRIVGVWVAVIVGLAGGMVEVGFAWKRWNKFACPWEKTIVKTTATVTRVPVSKILHFNFFFLVNRLSNARSSTGREAMLLPLNIEHFLWFLFRQNACWCSIWMASIGFALWQQFKSEGKDMCVFWSSIKPRYGHVLAASFKISSLFPFY